MPNGHEGRRVVGRQVERGLHRLLEHLDRLDHVVGGRDRHHRVRVPLAQHRGGEADGVGGVAAHGLAEEVVLGQLGEVVEDELAVLAAGADVDAVGGQDAAEAVVAEPAGGSCP
jgi:hypothetical protein